MSKLDMAKLIKTTRMAAKKYQPEILTGIGIAGMITTTVMAVQATPKALDILAEIKENHSQDTDRKQYSKDVITKVGPVYIPAALVGVSSIACIIGASSVNFRRNATLAAAYSLSESTLRDYQAKVVDTIGEKKEQSIRAAVAKDQIDKQPVSSSEVFITGKGGTLFFDPWSSRYFEFDIDQLKKIENELSRKLLTDEYVSLNEFYYEIGLAPTKIGDDIGWRVDKGLIEIKFNPILTDENKPCISIEYTVSPEHGYDRFN